MNFDHPRACESPRDPDTLSKDELVDLVNSIQGILWCDGDIVTGPDGEDELVQYWDADKPFDKHMLVAIYEVMAFAGLRPPER